MDLHTIPRDGRSRMVLEIRADTREIKNHWDARGTEDRGRTNTASL